MEAGTASWLQTLAELAMAMAGFSAVLIAFGGSGSGLAPIHADRLKYHEPLVVWRFPRGVDLSYRLSGGVSLPLLTMATVRIHIRFQRLRRELPEADDEVIGWLVSVAYSGMVTTVVLSGLCAAGIPEGHSAVMYLASLVTALALAGTRLVGFVLRLQPVWQRDRH